MKRSNKVNLNTQVISPRAFALLGFLIIAMLAYASCSFGAEAECANHCSEEKIEALEARNTAARTVVSPKYTPTVEATTRALGAAIRSTGFICDAATLVSMNDAVPGRTRFDVSCSGGPLEQPFLRFTVDVTTRIVVYPGVLR